MVLQHPPKACRPWPLSPSRVGAVASPSCSTPHHPFALSTSLPAQALAGGKGVMGEGGRGASVAKGGGGSRVTRGCLADKTKRAS
eukprot:596834-Rhodomonas_salina.2